MKALIASFITGVMMLPATTLAAGSYETGVYKNRFLEAGVATEEEIQQRVTQVYEQLFHDPDRRRYNDNDPSVGKSLFIPVGDDMGYIWDTGNDDVRSEGMSYGMMMALQMNRQDDFNRIWKWANTYSFNGQNGGSTGGVSGNYFAWEVSTDGNKEDSNPAPDGEEYFVTALFFAAHRWGNGDGIYNYTAQANKLLANMYGNNNWHYVGGEKVQYSLFQLDEYQIVFSPAKDHPDNFTDPSYHLPAFYELWARWAADFTDTNRDPTTLEYAGGSTNFWEKLAGESRSYWKNEAVDPRTGLNPDYSGFDGTPEPGENYPTNHDNFRFDAWRTIGNAALDYLWWQKDPWQRTYADTLQNFFSSESLSGGLDSHGSLFTLSGDLDFSDQNSDPTDQSPGLVAMNAMASLAASNTARANLFVEKFWGTPIPTGRYRYYDGMLYMFGMLALSGNYRIYCPDNACDAVSAPIPVPDPVEPQPAPVTPTTPVVTPTPGDGAGSVAFVEVESGTFTPSFRATTANWVTLYGNGDSVAFTVNLPPGEYSLVINGRSSNGSAAGISVLLDGVNVGQASFSSTTGEKKIVALSIAPSIAPSIAQSSQELTLLLESDSGDNDTLLDAFEIFSDDAVVTPVSSSSISSSSASSQAQSSSVASISSSSSAFAVSSTPQASSSSAAVSSAASTPVKLGSADWYLLMLMGCFVAVRQALRRNTKPSI